MANKAVSRIVGYGFLFGLTRLRREPKPAKGNKCICVSGDSGVMAGLRQWRRIAVLGVGEWRSNAETLRLVVPDFLAFVHHLEAGLARYLAPSGCMMAGEV